MLLDDVEIDCSQSPRRLRRSRAKGYRTPEGAVYVGRPTKWGNPFRITDDPREPSEVGSAEEAVDRYLRWLQEKEPGLISEARTELAGRDLVCWCALDRVCHADVLLAIANGASE